MEILVTKELTLRWGVCPGLSGWNPVITRGQTDEARGEVGDPEQEKDPPLTGLGQDQRNTVVSNLRTTPRWQW